MAGFGVKNGMLPLPVWIGLDTRWSALRGTESVLGLPVGALGYLLCVLQLTLFLRAGLPEVWLRASMRLDQCPRTSKAHLI